MAPAGAGNTPGALDDLEMQADMNKPICSVPQCGRTATRRGWCGMHYQRWRQHGDPDKVTVRTRAVCAFEGCDRLTMAHGLCETHNRQRSEGKPLTPIRSWRSNLERDEQGRKLCRSCLTWLAESEFGRNARHPDALSYQCRKCNKDKHRLANYGITVEQYDRLLTEQGGGCAICGGQCSSGRSLAVDHDHACCPGQRSCGACVRGLLCSECNQAIGKFEDDVSRLEAAVAYLKR